MQIVVKAHVKSVNGKTRIYPIGDKGKILMKLVRKSSLSMKDVERAKELGIHFEEAQKESIFG